ncbi:MAG TPA: hypothetical protein VGB43_07085 [Flavobacterium sp.]
MENNNQNDTRDENLRGQQQNTEYESQKAQNIDDQSSKQKSGSDSEDDNKFHEHHGNRKYESHSNHSSAEDQPGTTTDTNLGRERN